ncbi:MAG: carboxymuconolactone decarboxylase family protein [Gemmobacter sp.]|nr:carboxymuconolactone decarboxylase family protein [Gemmobacter sp.]
MTEDALRDRLEQLRATRGFLLPHHGALAAGAPGLHDAYLAMYRELTVAPRVLSPLDRECVWLAILVVAREGIGTHHLELFRQHGGTDALATALITLAGMAPSLDALAFSRTHWAGQLAALDPAAAYDHAVAALRPPLPEATAELALLAAHAARHATDGVAHHLRRAYALGVDEAAMVEALSYIIWPCGVNAFVSACETWHALMQAGAVTPSPRFKVWADMGGLGAFAPGAGAQVGGFQTEENRE